MIQVKDHLQREVKLISPPQRIISLCPSITETLFDLGLEKEVVGRTYFCIHPKEKIQGVSKVGGTKKVNIAKIRDLVPDLIIAVKEENTPEIVAELSQEFPVFVLDISTVSQALASIRELGMLLGKRENAAKLWLEVEEAWAKLSNISHKQKTAYLIWKDPLMAVGSQSYIHDVLEYVGLTNVFARHSRYPQIEVEELIQLDPELIFLSSEPYPFGMEHLAFFQQLLPRAKVHLVEGEAFSWYGSRMLYTADYLSHFLERLNP